MSKKNTAKDGLEVRRPLCEAKIKTYGNIWTRQVKFKKAGDYKPGHKHKFDHLHFVTSGRVEVRVYDNKLRDKIIFKKEYSAPAVIKVPKEHFHDIIALEDNSIGYCIQAIMNEDGTVKETDYAKDEDWIEEVKAFEKENGLQDEELK
jgi:quercetin dioxygenase-like cupin family protein